MGGAHGSVEYFTGVFCVSTPLLAPLTHTVLPQVGTIRAEASLSPPPTEDAPGGERLLSWVEITGLMMTKKVQSKTVSVRTSPTRYIPRIVADINSKSSF